MDLYSRSGLFIGPYHQLMAWATSITHHVSDVIGTEVACWSAGFGAPAGTLGWSFPVDGLAGVAANNEKMLGDATYHEMLAEGRQYAHPGSVQDSLFRLAHGELTGDRPPIGAVSTTTTATPAAPTARVIEYGVEMARLLEEITGVTQLFGMNLVGQFETVGFIGIHPSAEAEDASAKKLETHEEFAIKSAAGRDLFVIGSGHRRIATRVA